VQWKCAEYDRAVTETGSRRKAEAELAARQRRVAKLDIRPLTREENTRYQGEWNAVQERFVDAPTEAVAQAATLVTTVMRVRGYPTEDRDEAMEALSVDHAPTLARYREARTISERAGSGGATTDDLRNAMLQYRELFHELVVSPDDTAPGDGTAPADDAARPPAGTTTAPDAPASRDAAPVTTDTPAPATAADEPVRARDDLPETATTDGTPADLAGSADTTRGDDVATGEAVSPQRSRRG
jgi:hypothetical protein